VRLLDGSGMSGDVHVPFCEGLRVKLPWSTLLLDQGAGFEAQFPGHSDILLIEATASFGLGPLLILLRTRLH